MCVCVCDSVHVFAITAICFGGSRFSASFLDPWACCIIHCRLATFVTRLKTEEGMNDMGGGWNDSLACAKSEREQERQRKGAVEG